MRRVLFAYDHRFIPDGGTVYSENHFGSTFWNRYLDHAEELTVLGRTAALPDGGSPAEMLISSRPEVTFEFIPNLSSVRGALFYRASATRRITRLVSRHDAVIARLPSEIGLVALRAAERLGIPSAIEVVGCPLDGFRYHGSTLGRVYAQLAQQRMRRAVAKSRFAIYVTGQFLQGRYPAPHARVESASNVELSPLAPEILAQRLGRISERSARVMRIGLIGSLRTRAKGIHTVLAALSELRGRLPAVRFHVLGGGDKRPWIAEAEAAGVGDLVSFDGTLRTGEPVFEWLDEIDLYLQPSFQEGLPRALLEAMSRGCPAIGSDLAGIPELLDREDLIAPGDHSRLADLIFERSQDEQWMRDRAQRNFHVAGRYEKKHIDRRRNSFWSEFAEHARHTARSHRT